ncbi:MAG: META domain-containing protein [Ectothiorhodospiraceae bacterium]|jgi:heat shock protein HslJ
MKRQLRLSAAVFTGVAILWVGGVKAGSTAAAGVTAGKNASAGPSGVATLAGSRWRLVEFQSMDDAIGTVRPDDPSRYTMQLKKDGVVTMRLNCNRARGRWSAVPGADAGSGRFEFGPLAVTRARCRPPSMDEQIAAHAEFVRSYLLKDGRLYLSLMADGGIYAWEPAPDGTSGADIAAAPEQGGPRNWEVIGLSGALNLRERPSTVAAILTTYAAGTILDNLGCAQAGGRVWCDVQELGGGPRGYVAAEFLKPAVSPDGSVATGPDDSALRAGQGQFDATGRIPCAPYPGEPTVQCEFGVARAGGGYATVVVRKPRGGSRAIFFRMGRAIGADTSEADPGDFGVTREGDLNVIRIGRERYEVPDAVVLGG